MARLTIDTKKLVPGGGSVGPIYPRVLFWLGVLGVLFYAIGPLVFPAANIRAPELLPIYTLMMGLGQLLTKEKPSGNDDK